MVWGVGLLCAERVAEKEDIEDEEGLGSGFRV
jgi:hypothetical protein